MPITISYKRDPLRGRRWTPACELEVWFHASTPLWFLCVMFGHIFPSMQPFCVFNLTYMRNAGWFWLGIVLSYVWHIGYVYIFFENFIWHLWFWWHGFMWHTNFNKFCIITLLLSSRDTDVVPVCSVTGWNFLTQSWCFLWCMWYVSYFVDFDFTQYRNKLRDAIIWDLHVASAGWSFHMT